jgi:high-affinity iron transporter
MAAEIVRSSLNSAQAELMFDRASAAAYVRQAQSAYAQGLNELGQPDWRKLEQALSNEANFAREVARLWTGILHGAYQKLESSIQQNDRRQARRWLLLREYRRASRFAPPATDATDALESEISTVITAVRADLLGTYQARLSEALLELEAGIKQNFQLVAAQNAALAQGYFLILAPFYPEQNRQATTALFAALATAPSVEGLERVRQALQGWRAAPLSEKERNKRAAQVLRFLALVPLEYGRGVKTQNGSTQVTLDIEIAEAVAFWQGAQAALQDLEPNLLPVPTKAALRDLNALGETLRAAQSNRPVSFEQLRVMVQNLERDLGRLIPAAWRTGGAEADLDVIREHLGQFETALLQGAFEQAETARISAYAILESGVEARIRFFEPQLSSEIELLFWNGNAPVGLARIVRERLPLEQFRNTRRELLQKLEQAARVVGTDTSPAAAFLNALVIVFREGLEAILILAALLGSLKRPEVRHLRRPLWLGAVAALLASAVTFLVMRGIVNAFAIFGERLEAVVSLIAIVVLLIIMNWFFHSIYWTERLATFHKQKHSLMGVASGQILGLAALGFSAMYREGFETALFLQSLVLQAELSSVLSGAVVAALGVGLIGVLVFVLQTKLPHKKMLIFTGALICAVLWVMVGNTVRIWQVVGWLPIHNLGVGFPAWLGLWFGTFATWEGVLLPALAVGAVIGSYFLAEGQKTRSIQQKTVVQVN